MATEKNIKPILDEPKSNHAMEFEKDFNKEMLKRGVNLTEVDHLLTEKKRSLKKKIFSLSKMEALVFSDPKLTAVYDEMAENGEEKYGYHYNETIMNMIFNDYILNSSKYLQKYKMAIPKKKKRRDKSGINALRKSGEEIEKKREKLKKEKQSMQESSASMGSGGYETPISFKDDVKNVSKEIDTEEEKRKLEKVEVAKPGKEKRAYGPTGIGSKNVSSAIEKPSKNSEIKKPFYNGGKILKISNNNINENQNNMAEEEIYQPDNNEDCFIESNGFKYSVSCGGKFIGEFQEMEDSLNTVKKWREDNNFYPNIWFVSDHGNYSLIDDQGNIIKETTSAGGGATGSGGVADYTYTGPAAWGSGDLMKGGKKEKKDKESFWSGGKVIQENNYLTNPSEFKKYFDMLNENFDPSGMITTTEQYKQLVQQRKSEGRKLDDNDIKRISEQALYDLAVRIADRMLPIGWDQLPDINSMWDYIDENGGMSIKELKTAVKEAVNDRLSEEGFNLDMFEGELNEKSKSKAQQKLFGMARAVQKGKLSPSEVGKDVKKIAKNVDPEDVEDFAATKHKNLPEKVDETINQPDYIYYLIDPKSMKIETGWEFKEDALDHKAEWDESNYPMKVLSKNFLISKGIDPSDDSNWAQPNLNEENLDEEIEKASATEIYDNEISRGKTEDEAAQTLLNAIIKDMWKTWDEEKIKRAKQKIINRLSKSKTNEVAPAVMAIGGAAAHGAGEAIGGRVADKMGLEEHHLSTVEEKLAFIQKVSSKLMPEPMIPGYLSILSDASDEKIHDAYITAEKMLREKGIDPETITETMIEDNPESMKLKPPITTSQGGDFPTGMQIASDGMNENKMKKTLEKYNHELNLFETHFKNIKNMNEDRKHSALVLKDRLGTENTKNFKDDLKNSTTKDVIDITKELEWKDQQTDVGKDPQKLGMDIEKQHLKNTDKGTSLKNVGNSTNNKGDEIPKRNLTDDEVKEVDLYRKGLGDANYDNEPDERYMERMKRDMGEEEFKKREARIEFEADKPMYNKDTQPVEDGIEKAQFDKNKSKWNERFGLKETIVTGKYRDVLNKKRLMEVKFSDIKEVQIVENDSWFELSFEGLGNTYDSKVNVNETAKNAFDEYKFYTDGTNVFVKQLTDTLLESKNVENVEPINEQFEKMKHLLGYKPKDFINTKNIKL